MKKIIPILLAIVLFSVSCEEMIEREPREFLSPTEFAMENDIVLALTGTYKALTGMGLPGADSKNVEPIITDFIIDNGFMDKSWMGIVEFWDQGHNVNSELAKRKWTRNYMGILRANTVLEYIDQVPMQSDEIRERYRAEARFLRAFFYTDLILFYGDVPFRNKPEGLEEQHIERTSQEEILGFIYDELDAAAEYLPAVYDETDRGRATKGAAFALKAWVALNYYDYSKANTACDSVIQSGVYQLYENFANLFKPESEMINREVIFDAQYLTGKKNEDLTDSWTTYFYAWGSYMADLRLLNEYYTLEGLPADSINPAFDPKDSFKNRDPRMNATMILPYTMLGFDYKGDTTYFIPYNIKAHNFSGLKIRKYVDYNVEHNMRGHSYTGTNSIYFRFADILLMKAEALCELNGAASEQEIVDLVNQVRQRPSVMMPRVEEVEGTGLSQEQLREIIRHERRVELAFEGSRIIDIRRWDIGEEAYSDGLGYDPNLLYYYIVNDLKIEKMEKDGIVPSSMIRYLKRTDYFKDKAFKTEEDFRAQMAAIFTPANGFDNNELETYGDIIVEYVEPQYEVYVYRRRTFNSVKGYLWPIPFIEMQANNMISINNPGY